MKIIITGATGSLGAYLTRYFFHKGHEVIATGRMATPPPALLQCAEYIQADITGPYTLPQADVCIHTAALSKDDAPEKAYYTPNVIGTAHTAEASAHCAQFIQISSSAVYLPDAQLITEEMAGLKGDIPLSHYGKSKLLAEEKLRQVSRHPACFILRPRAIYGAGDKVILPLMLKMVHGDKLQRLGDMKVRISMTHYQNVAHAAECCMNSPKKGIHVYNVSDDHSYVLIEVLRKLMAEIYGYPLAERPIPILPLKILASLGVGKLSRLLIRSLTNNMVLDISKIKSELGYQPNIDFDAALPNLGAWVRQIGGPEVLKTGAERLAWE